MRVVPRASSTPAEDLSPGGNDSLEYSRLGRRGRVLKNNPPRPGVHLRVRCHNGSHEPQVRMNSQKKEKERRFAHS